MERKSGGKRIRWMNVYDIQSSSCVQVRAVASQDFLVVPHGSQNVNFIFAKPGAVVIEASDTLLARGFG
jgi:hypothetical protein